MSKPIILTGDRPTGPLHIGHYFGSLVERKKAEQTHQLHIMIADVQALTDNWENPEKVRNNVLEVAADNLALGFDTDKTTIFIQSRIPEIAELTVFFSNLVTVNRLKRNPTVKTEIEQKARLFGTDGESVTLGFLGYPVSQAADILSLKATVVPVGEDQLPMIEQTREIAGKFNRLYKTETFPLPEAKLSNAPRIIGLDGSAKMGKSLNNAVNISDTPEETIKKIKAAKTDSENEIRYDPKKRPEISNLVLLYSLVSGIDTETAVAELKGINYGTFKTQLAEKINVHFEPIRQKRSEIMKDPDAIFDTLAQGTEKARIEIKKTMQDVRTAMYIDYPA